MSSHDEDGEYDEGDVLDTPGREKKWDDATTTPARMKRTRSTGPKGGVNLTLRDQEKVSLPICCKLRRSVWVSVN